MTVDEQQSSTDNEQGTAEWRAKLVVCYERWEEAVKLKADGKLEKAAQVGIEVLELQRDLFGDVHEAVAVTLEWLATLHLNLQDMPAADTAASELLRVQETLHGEDGWQTVTARWHLDYVQKMAKVPEESRAKMFAIEVNYARLFAAAEYTEAAKTIQELVSLEEPFLGTTHPYLASTHLSYADSLLSAGMSQEAEVAAGLAFSIRKKQFGHIHPETAHAASVVAKARIQQNNHEGALDLLRYARAAWKTTGYPIDAAWTDCWRGDSLAALNRNVEALAAYNAQLTAFRELGHPIGEADALMHLADLYSSLANYGKAEPLYIKARDIRKKVLGKQHPDYATSLCNLADLYRCIADYGKAEPLCIQARDIYRRIYGEEHPHYATSLNNLAALYSSMGDYAKAEPLYIQASHIRKRVLGGRAPGLRCKPEQSRFAVSLNG